jgi:ribonucleoside-triphosphate reductase
MYILMCGTGVGFSVEKKYVDQLPRVAENFHPCDTVIDVYDSKIGWAKAFRQLISLLYNGDIPRWTTHRVRPAGARLKTFGGRASGPEPLEDLFHFSVQHFTKAAGRQLTTLECHDLMCKIADIVVVGGVRRSAMISLSDVVMTECARLSRATGGLITASVVWLTILQCMVSSSRHGTLHEGVVLTLRSKSGERGMFSRYACQNIAARNGRRET